MPTCLFRAIGYVWTSQTDTMVCAIKVADDVIRPEWVTSWPEGTALHTASSSILVGEG
jgi:hypothetical protein